MSPEGASVTAAYSKLLAQSVLSPTDRVLLRGVHFHVYDGADSENVREHIAGDAAVGVAAVIGTRNCQNHPSPFAPRFASLHPSGRDVPRERVQHSNQIKPLQTSSGPPPAVEAHRNERNEMNRSAVNLIAVTERSERGYVDVPPGSIDDEIETELAGICRLLE